MTKARGKARQEDELVFVPLGGAGEIGMNLNLYGYGPENRRQWIMIDLGVMFGGDDTPGIDVIMPGTPAPVEWHPLGGKMQIMAVPAASLDASVEERRQKLDEELRLAEQDLAEAERAYRRGTD